jgi:hypothetical protein
VKFRQSAGQGQAEPGPVWVRAKLLSTWPKGSSAWASWSGDMPMPVSVTEMARAPSRKAAPTDTLPPVGVNLTLFDSRLSSACLILRSSARTVATLFATLLCSLISP